MLGGRGKKDAGAVVTAAPAHPLPKGAKTFGVGGVSMPSTIKHSAYIGKPEALNQMLKLAFEELSPRYPLLVLPNGSRYDFKPQLYNLDGIACASACLRHSLDPFSCALWLSVRTCWR